MWARTRSNPPRTPLEPSEKFESENHETDNELIIKQHTQQQQTTHTLTRTFSASEREGAADTSADTVPLSEKGSRGSSPSYNDDGNGVTGSNDGTDTAKEVSGSNLSEGSRGVRGGCESSVRHYDDTPSRWNLYDDNAVRWRTLERLVYQYSQHIDASTFDIALSNATAFVDDQFVDSECRDDRLYRGQLERDLERVLNDIVSRDG